MKYNEELLFQRLDELDNKLAALLEQIGPKRAKIEASRTESVFVDLTRERVNELERLFWTIVNSPYLKRSGSYRFPKALLISDTRANVQGVVVSVLINQASLRKVFKRRGAGDPSNETAAACARRLLDQTNLVLLPLHHTKLAASTKTLVAFSPGEAVRVAHSTVKLPTVWKGWTCRERALARPGPLGWIDAPEDPCGRRVWSDGEPVEVEHPEEKEEETPRRRLVWPEERAAPSVPEVAGWLADKPAKVAKPKEAVVVKPKVKATINKAAWAALAEEVIEDTKDPVVEDGGSEEDHATTFPVAEEDLEGGSVLDAMERDWQAEREAERDTGSYRQRVQFVDDE